MFSQIVLMTFKCGQKSCRLFRNLDGDDDDDDITAKDLIKANFLVKPDRHDGEMSSTSATSGAPSLE